MTLWFSSTISPSEQTTTPNGESTTDFVETETENLHIIYPEQGLVFSQEDSGELTEEDSTEIVPETLNEDFLNDNTKRVQEPSELFSNNAEEISLVSGGPSVQLPAQPRIEDSFYRQLTSLKTNRLNVNPIYSQEEFTYNQDPIVIDHTIDNSLQEFNFAIRPRGERHIESDSLEFYNKKEKTGKSVSFKKLSERLSPDTGESIKLVNTIEYRPEDSDHYYDISRSYRSGVVGGSDIAHISTNMSHKSLASR